MTVSKRGRRKQKSRAKQSISWLADELMDILLRCEVDGRTRGNGTEFIYLTPDNHWLCDEHYDQWCDLSGIPMEDRRVPNP